MVQPKVCICYWGLTRSLKFVYKSHIQNLYNKLKESGIEFNIYLHTWDTKYNTIWENDNSIPIDKEEGKLINPDYFIIDDQNIFLEQLEHKFNDYYTNGEHWPKRMVKNMICSLESKKRVSQMVLDSNILYDYIIYIRPDLNITSQFDPSILNKLNQESGCIPNYDHFSGYNDRFLIIPFGKIKEIGMCIDEAVFYRKNVRSLVGEFYCKYILDKYLKNIHQISLAMTIVRPT